MGAGASASAREGSGFYCHRCQTMLEQLGDGGLCPHCQGGFVEESANAMALAQAVHWLVTEDRGTNAMEARIGRLLDDLREHLSSVEGIHNTMSFTMDIPATPKLEPAPPEVRNGITEVRMDSATAKQMRQTPQCVICCSDFEVGETLSQLPGCHHLFHSGCICQWLERAANCPICRCDLRQAVGLERRDVSTASSVLLDTDRSQYTNTLSPSPSPPGTAYRGFINASPLGYSHPTLWRSQPHISAAPEIVAAPSGVGHQGVEGWLFAEGRRPRSSLPAVTVGGPLHAPVSPTIGSSLGEANVAAFTSPLAEDAGPQLEGSRLMSLTENRPITGGSPPPPPPPRRGTSSVLVGAGSAISSPTMRAVARPGSVADPRAQRSPPSSE